MIETHCRPDASHGHSEAILTLDEIDWEILAIEAKHSGVAPEAAEVAMNEAGRLFNDPTAMLQDVLPAARGILALLRYQAQRTPRTG